MPCGCISEVPNRHRRRMTVCVTALPGCPTLQVRLPISLPMALDLSGINNAWVEDQGACAVRHGRDVWSGVSAAVTAVWSETVPAVTQRTREDGRFYAVGLWPVG